MINCKITRPRGFGTDRVNINCRKECCYESSWMIWNQKEVWFLQCTPWVHPSPSCYSQEMPSKNEFLTLQHLLKLIKKYPDFRCHVNCSFSPWVSWVAHWVVHQVHDRFDCEAALGNWAWVTVVGKGQTAKAESLAKAWLHVLNWKEDAWSSAKKGWQLPQPRKPCANVHSLVLPCSCLSQVLDNQKEGWSRAIQLLHSSLVPSTKCHPDSCNFPEVDILSILKLPFGCSHNWLENLFAWVGKVPIVVKTFWRFWYIRVMRRHLLYTVPVLLWVC